MDHSVLITVKRVNSQSEAEIFRTLLEENGIRTALLGEIVHDILPLETLAPIKIKVAAEDAQRAREILESGFDECDFREQTTGKGRGEE
ncbi:MAG: DUF2007 domain-containing protein [Rikenellaceae bacterium]|nr:DUF2007 domain-containing protein [Rikenellaceae bacterium]